MPQVLTKTTNASGVWETVPFTEEEVAQYEADREAGDLDMNRVRQERDQTLARTDWTQLPDVALSVEKVAEWATFRQTLRDLPANYSRVSEVVWPTPPE